MSNSVELIFDEEMLTLKASYISEIAAHRALKNWVKILGKAFVLERDYDYMLKRQNGELTCSFLTASGRYAKWRLCNNNAPEHHYLLSVAHLSNFRMDLKEDKEINAQP